MEEIRKELEEIKEEEELEEEDEELEEEEDKKSEEELEAIADWIIEHIKDYSDDEMEFIWKLECLIERLEYDTGDCYVDFILELDLYREEEERLGGILEEWLEENQKDLEESFYERKKDAFIEILKERVKYKDRIGDYLREAVNVLYGFDDDDADDKEIYHEVKEIIKKLIHHDFFFDRIDLEEFANYL